MKNDQFKEWARSESGRKIILAIFLFLGAAIIVIGFSSIGGVMKKPFGGRTGWAKHTEQKRKEEIIQLQTTDTDSDGLSDFDEKFVYGTSVYIADTDSDGLSDGNEIENEKDPLCPEGKDCGYAFFDSGSDGTDIDAKTSSEIRKELIASGVDSDLLAGVDDKTLSEIYQDTVDSVSQSSNNSMYTAAEIRAFFREIGMDESVLEEVKDDELVQLYDNTVIDLGYDPMNLDAEELGLDIPETGESNDLEITNEEMIEVRRYLVENGVPENELDMLTDEELINLVNNNN